MVGVPDQFKISVSDYSVVGGTEHYVITVHRGVYDSTKNVTNWSLELEMNGLATNGKGEVSPMGSSVTEHTIKAYVTGGKQTGNFSLKNLSQYSGVSLSNQIFNPKGEKINKNDPNGYLYDNSDQFKSYSSVTGNVLFTGSETDTLKVVSGMLKAGNAINANNYAYQIPGIDNIFYNTQNSNRTAFTLIESGLLSVWGTGFRSDALDSITRLDAPGSGKSFNLGDNFWQKITPKNIDAKSFAPKRQFSYIDEAFAKINKMNFAQPVQRMTIGNKVYLAFEDTAKLVIDGTEYVAKSVIDTLERSAKGLYDFVLGNKTVYSNMAQDAFNLSLSNSFAEIARLYVAGQKPSATDMLKIFAKQYGFTFSAAVLSQDKMIQELSTFIDSKMGRGYGSATTGALVNFMIQAGINATTWKQADFTKQGTVIFVQYLTPVIVAKNFQSLTDSRGVLTSTGSAIASAVTTAAVAIINNPNMNSSGYLMTGVQAGVANTQPNNDNFYKKYTLCA